jgi:hypothetical protein
MKTIGIFKTGCPSGWTRLSAWDDKFLQGAAAYNETGGGAATHTHYINMPSKTNFYGSNSTDKHPGNQRYGPEYFAHYGHSHTLDPPSANTSTEASLPEHIDVVFCYKED